jgi:prophage regulatory protein
MTQLPETGFLKLAQIIGKPNANPPIPAIIPVSKASWYDGIKSGRYPAPVSIGNSRGKFYKVEEILKLIASV